ncbi:YHYH protein [Aliiglaciecola sp. 3_MG-2023]|uniref:YHYH protein n=1 Tax=Aliiglaciecola sp. 3_MG-2023 TaxID=3062644 RepID=UPI0026E2E40A|nr:YHYH protein [Aliiglaciecola sp. 3_MG-2023]MDO6695431.1 YHYH protein [Aliiglaciecola sp. 3_MG-2023]
MMGNGFQLFKIFYWFTLLLVLSACSGTDTSDTDAVTTDEDTVVTDPDEDGNDGLDTTDSGIELSLFRDISSSSTVSCTLDDGTQTTCYELVFNVNEIRDGSGSGELIDDEAGPFCPSSYTGDDGGVGIYDGNTGPGFQNLVQTLWDNMAIDGYDIIDESAGIICIQDPGGSRANIGSNCTSYCLNASADDGLTITYTIPVTPVPLATPDQLGEIEHIGLSLDGVPITGDPPSVVGRGGNIPSLDHCGGHHDPAGYYHWHGIPESADVMHAEQGTNDQADCSVYITQDNTALSGFARDGYPIYAYQDLVDGEVVTPSDLDSCNGHTGITAEYPDGIYHYHASLDAPNLPTCITGASVSTRTSPYIR